MTRLHIEPEAEEELEEAATRYEGAVPDLGRQFLAEMRERLRDVLEAPMRFRVFGDSVDVRCAHAVGRFRISSSSWSSATRWLPQSTCSRSCTRGRVRVTGCTVGPAEANCFGVYERRGRLR